MYTLKSEVFLSFILVLIGAIDCLTTVIGVLYFGAVELNPLLTGIVSTNIWAFLVLKISATVCVGFTYILANKTLNKAVDNTTKAFKYSQSLIKITYAGLVMFLTIVVINNLTILLA